MADRGEGLFGVGAAADHAEAAALGGLPDIKLHCSMLAQEGIEAAVADYYLKKDGKLPEGYKVPANTISPKVGEGNVAEEEEHYVSEDNRNTDEK